MVNIIHEHVQIRTGKIYFIITLTVKLRFLEIQNYFQIYYIIITYNMYLIPINY